MKMQKIEDASCHSMLHLIKKTACGTVYPCSIAEGFQTGDIYKMGDSVLFWHDCGFAYLYGVCENSFLEELYQQFLSDETNLPRRFILFSDDPAIGQFFRNKPGLVFGKRYSFSYPEVIPARPFPVPSGYTVRELDRPLLHALNGRITPFFSWQDASAFLENGKGYCVLHEENPVSWAFSAAVSTEEIDIGVETDAAYRQKGLGLLAAYRMIQYCFEQKKRPVWSCDAANIASQKTAGKLGFRKETEYTTIRNHNTL